jgi:uncharacterized protein YukE
LTLHQGLIVRLSALAADMQRVERTALESWSGPAAERFHDEVARQLQLIRQVRSELLEAS